MSAGYFDKAVRLSFGQVAAGAAIEVRHTGGDLADIYSNAAMTTPLANPGVVGSDGRYEFYALFGVYNITVGAGASAATYRFKLDGDGVNFLTYDDFVSAVADGYAPAGGTVVTIAGLSWMVIPVGHADYGTDPLSSLPGWMAVGDVYADHWGASVDADGATNHSAIQAALNSKYGTINLKTTGTYNVSGQLRYAGYNKMLQGAGFEFASISFSDDFDGSCILFEPSDPLENSYRSGNGIANIILSGNASTRPNRWAVDVRKQEVFRLDNVRWGGFSFGLRVAGGQLSSFSRFYGFGSGLLPGEELAGSTQIKITDAENTSGAQKNYTCTFSQFVIGGSSNKNISDVITLEQADGASFSDGYVSFGARSLLRLSQVTGAAVTATFFSNVYFDGVSQSTGTPHFMTAIDSAAVGQVSMTITGGHIGNYAGDIFAMDVANNLRNLRMSNVNLSSSATGLGTIRGQTSPVDGLKLLVSNCTFRGAPEGLSIIGGQSINVDGVFSDIDDADGCLKLSGTIRQKKLSVSVTDCVAGVSDTSTGDTGGVYREWENAFPVVSGDGVQSSATDDTAGRLMTVGAFGLGGAAVPLSGTDSLVSRNLPTGIYQYAANSIPDAPETAAWYHILEVTYDSSIGRRHYVSKRITTSVSTTKVWSGIDDGAGGINWSPVPIGPFLVGTVSQSGGVVTGAVIERGSNANGEYVRFADGTQICWKMISGLGPINNLAGSIYFDSGQSIGTLPATFVGAPNISITSNGNGSVSAFVSQTSGSYFFLCRAASSPSTNFTVSVLAIGRWF